MSYKESLRLSNLNANTKEYPFQNDPSFLQEAYGSLGIYFPFLDCDQSLNIGRPSGYVSAPSCTSTPGLAFTPGCASTPGFVSTPSYFSAHKASSIHSSNKYGNKYLSCPVDTIPVDYFNLMLHPEREIASVPYTISEIDEYKENLDSSIIEPKQCAIQNSSEGVKLSNSSSAIFKMEFAKKKNCKAPISPILDASFLQSPALSTSSIVPQLSFATSRKTNKKEMDSVKKHVCNFCDRRFSRKYDARRHIRIHTGDKPYICPGCSKGFARSDALRRHLLKEPECSACSKSYPIVKSTKNHKY
ncbi:hypothetical protein G6F56_004223 [Rhizopus delemar]|uniref:C2H2-type domain-containing protein n=1 Tax=Rhizopus stolonifer TaxID=4846 RepID=A0A367IQP1_RHIST|nr:hypothetical protein G6F56_004223 [Rhizopus delemar]RCH80014.1 hypothetical protein CU098_004289 [Rhizopus stolonifer]